MNFVGTGKSQVRSVKCCVLFNPKDGAILHTHRVVTMDGAAETPDHLVEERTRQLAKELGLDVASLELLHIDPKVLEPGVIYKVDRRKRSLVAGKRETIGQTKRDRTKSVSSTPRASAPPQKRKRRS